MESKDKAVEGATRMIEAGLLDAAKALLAANKVKATIVGNRIIFDNDVTEPNLMKFITQDEAMLKVKDAIRKLAGTNHEVLITGPTGTGKELLAKALHGKREGRMQFLNAGGLPEQLVESELFGHVRGAFTGATQEKIGLIQTAAGGTLVIDEVGELPLLAQVKLLRVLNSDPENRHVRKVGGTVDEPVKCRFVFSTNKSLKEMCKAGLFRVDLYARISTFELFTTALEERVKDIPLILESIPGGKEFLAKYGPDKYFNTELNVRSLQQHVKRYQVLGILP